MLNQIETALLVITGLTLLALTAAWWTATSQLNRGYSVAAEPVVVPEGEDAVAEGERLANIRGCFWCHGNTLDGGVYFANARRGVIAVAPSLRQKIREYSSAEFARVVRHGVRPDGTSLQPAMPSFAYFNMSDEDMGLIMSYLASVPEREGYQGRFRLLPVGWFRWMGGHLPPNVAELIEHDAFRPDPALNGDPVARGRYLAESTCTECHGNNGRLRVPGSPDLHIAAAYTRDQFFELMRSGVPLGGRAIDYHMVDASKYRYIHFFDSEVDALYQYFRSLVPQPSLAEGRP